MVQGIILLVLLTLLTAGIYFRAVVELIAVICEFKGATKTRRSSE